MRYEIDLISGAQVTGHFPDREDQFPRLLYHRHFMISETCFSIEQTVQGAPDPSTLTPEERVEYDRIRPELDRAIAFAETFRKCTARRILDENPGERIRLYMSVHAIPTPDQLLEGKKLTDDEFYADLYLIREFQKEEL